MKTTSLPSHIATRKALWLAVSSLIAALTAVGVAVWMPAASAHSNDPAPLIAILTPREGASLNAASLRVQALVAAVRPRRGESFVFNGQTVEGRNAGRVRRLELALDGVPVQSLDTTNYGRQFVADFRVDLSALGDGPHNLTMSAVQGHGNAETTEYANRTFTLDRSLIQAEANRVEDAATPKAFAGFRVRGWDGQDDDDADEEEPWQCPPRFDLKGTIMLGTQSDGIDLARDRVVVALGSQTKVLEPGMLQCNQRGVCRFEGGASSFLQFVELKRKESGRWKYRLRGTGPLPGAGASTLSLRVGNDWGGIDLTTGERLAGLRPNLDTARQAQALIGTAGGTVETVDASGVVIRLEIPPNALTQDTPIKVTPLQASPLAGAPTSLHPGVKFEPEGLQFAEPATLTMDFSATNQSVGNQDAVFLLTSPMTALPLFGRTDPGNKVLTARLHHFSVARPGGRNNSQTDLSWANALLLGNQNFTLSELELLVSLITNPQQAAQFTQLATNSIAALASALCPSSITSPTDQALERLLQLENIGQELGVDTNALGVRGCAEQVFRALIEQHGLQASINPSDGNLARLLNDASKAQLLGFDNLDTLALQRLAAAVRSLAAQAQEQACAGNNTVATNMLTRAVDWVPSVATVDETLAADIQRALDDIRLNRLSCAAMRVTLNPATNLVTENPTNLWFYRSRYSAPCEQVIVTPGGSNSYGCDTIPGSARFGGSPTAPPLSLEGQLGKTKARVSVTQPSPNVLAVDLNGTAEPSRGDQFNQANGYILADITFTRAGVFDLTVNTNWAEDFEFLGSVGASVAKHGATPADQTVPIFWSSYNPNGIALRSTARLVVPGPTTLRLNFGVFLSQSEGGYITGSGRLITATFTPSP